MDKVFMDFMDEDFFKEKEFDANSFIDGLGDIDEMTVLELLEKVMKLNVNDRKTVFMNEKLRAWLKEWFLFESAGNQWYYYRKMLKVISPVGLLSLYSVSELKEFFSKKDSGSVSVFFNALCECDVNKTIRYVLNDNEMLEYFLEHCSDAYYEELDYDLVKSLILKIQNGNLKFNNDFLADLSLECQQELIKEPEISDDTLVCLLSSFRNSVKSDFFMNDTRAVYL